MSKRKWEAVFVGDKDNDAWALFSHGNEKQPSHWYNTEAEALAQVQESECPRATPCEWCGSEEMDEIMSPNVNELCTDCTGETVLEEA